MYDASGSDEARFGELGVELAEALAVAIPGWVERECRTRVEQALTVVTVEHEQRIHAAATEVAAALSPTLRELLTADVDSATESPLAALRAGVGPATSALVEIGVPEVRRDEFVVARFPDDVYDLGPSTFADIDPSLHGLGVMWGAARAHVHMRRRRGTRP